MKPKVKVGFYLSGDDVDFHILTEEIGIVPTKVRKKADWPQVSISMGIAKDSWLLETQKEECKVISNQLDKMCEMLFPKVDVIRTLIQKYKLESSVTIVVEMEAGNGPEFVLSKDHVAFLALINAEIGFDLYFE